MTEQDLNERLGSLRQELWQGRIKTAEGTSPQAHQLRAMRRQMARIQTVLSARRNSAARGA